MKKLLTTLFLASLFWVVNGQTNVYHPFPDSNAVWNITSSQWCGANTWQRLYSITINGDTLINDTSYHKLMVPAVIHTLDQWTCDFPGIYVHPGYYAGAIRQDTAAKKVFIVNRTENIERLLYDFNLQVGDTITGSLETFGYPPETVLSIDSVLIGNDYRKRWFINDCYNIYLIEGIGATYGLIETYPACGPDRPEIAITCFTQNSFTLYPDTTHECELLTSITEIPISKLTSTLYPNPATNSATLEFENPTNTAFNLQVFDITGREVMEQSGITTNRITLNTQHLPAGIYHYRLMAAEEKLQSFGKLIIH